MTSVRLRPRRASVLSASIFLAGSLVPASPGSAESASPPAERIAFLRLTDPYWQVFVMDAGGDDVRQLTTSPVDKTHVDARPGTNEILYQTNQGALFLLDLRSGDETRLLERVGAREPRFSPDGARLVYETSSSDPASGRSTLWLAKADGSSPEKLCDDAPPGAHAIFVSAHTILHTTTRREADGGLAHDFHLVELDGKNEHVATPDPEPMKFDPSAGLGAEGRIAYASLRTGFYEIWTWAVGDETPRPLTRLHGSAGHPAWSPDGGAIAFDFEGDEPTQIYRVGLDGGEPVALTHGPAPSRKPVWVRSKGETKEVAP